MKNWLPCYCGDEDDFVSITRFQSRNRVFLWQKVFVSVGEWDPLQSGDHRSGAEPANGENHHLPCPSKDKQTKNKKKQKQTNKQTNRGNHHVPCLSKDKQTNKNKQKQTKTNKRRKSPPACPHRWKKTLAWTF